MSPNQETVLGLDLGGTSVKCVVATREGELLKKDIRTFPTPHSNQWLKTMESIFHETSQTFRLTGVGVSAPGLADRDQTCIRVMPSRFPGLEGLQFKHHFNAPWFIPVMNDAHCALLGEAWLGAARGIQNAILLTLGTGVGGAILSEGKIMTGHLGRAGHLGHVSLNPHGPLDITRTPGSLEDLIGNHTIQTRTHGKYQTTHDLVAAYAAGNEEAKSVWLESLRNLAAAISSFINILDPERVIIGGGIAKAGPHLFEPLTRYVREFEWKPGPTPVEIQPAQLGEYAGAIGAAHCSLQNT
jgi:glucokinase